MEGARFVDAFLPDGAWFPFAICPRCNTTQTAPILDEKLNTLMLNAPIARISSAYTAEENVTI